MNLRSYLDSQHVHYDWSHHDTAYTAQELAMKENISGKRVVKPVLVQADGQYLLCALPAASYVDLDRLRSELHALDAKLANEPELNQIFTDCELGAEPPIGSLFGLPTIMDDSLEKLDQVIFQAGTHQDAVRMSLDDYRRVTQPKIASFGRPRP